MKPVEADDPMELQAVPAPDDARARREMIACIADEYARAGWNVEAIVGLFSNQAYSLTHAVWLMEGEATVRELIEAAAAPWQALRPRQKTRLPVIS